MCKPLIAGAVALLLVLAFPIYFRAGWDRKSAERDGDGPLDQSGSSSVSYSWHVKGGFTCTYPSGEKRSSYWF